MFIPGNRSSAGFPSPADDYIDKPLDLNELLISNKTATFFMRVDGDDLLASGIRHGDLLLVDRSVTATPGKTVVAVVDGELILRKMERQGQTMVLVSDLETVKPITFDGDDVQIWGVASYVVHQL